MPSPPPLDKKQHLKYWTRCLKSPLPHQYTGNDSSRLLLAFFMVGGIELLTCPSDLPGSDSPPLPSLITEPDRLALREWVLSLAHPSGAGFAGSPNMLPPPIFKTADDDYDPLTRTTVPNSPESANIAATFFALLILATSSSPSSTPTAFSRLNRRAILKWLKRLQRPDGSFGEIVSPHGIVCGGRDMRYCYLAASIRWILRDPEASPEEDSELDFNVPKLIEYISTSQTFDGGIGESGAHESHAGYAYCAVAALSLLDRPADLASSAKHESHALEKGIQDKEAFVKFCVSRQFAYLDPPSGDEEDEEDDEDGKWGDQDQDNFYLPKKLADLSLDESLTYIAFNGRCNKVADTCYTWWTGGALALLDKLDVLDSSKSATRAFLMDKTQHMVGGFGKFAGSPPDVYHSFLGLAFLATLDRTADDLPHFDEALCVSTATVERIVEARKSMLARGREVNAEKGMSAGLLDLAKLMANREGQLRAEKQQHATT